MSTPSGSSQGEQPDQPYTGPYGTGYGGAQYGTPPPPGQQQPYGQQSGGYPYSPYGTGTEYPAGLDDKTGSAAAPRPPVMIGALVVLLLSCVPWLLVGIGFVLLPDQVVSIVGELSPEEQATLTESGLSVETIVQFGGWVVLGLAALFALFAVLAFVGQNWARILVTVLTAGFFLVNAFLAVLAGGVDLQSGGTVLLAVVGVVLMFLAPSNAFFAGRRRR